MSTDEIASKLITVDLADLIEHPQYQIRHQTSAETVLRYADAMRTGVDFPPITVAVLNGAPVLVDGHHRVAAARRAERRSLTANIVTAEPNEIPWLAAQANMRNGLPLTRKEAREVFRAYVKARKCFTRRGCVKSSREMEADLQRLRRYPTLLDWMGKDFPNIWRQMRDDSEQQRKGKKTMAEHEQALADNAVSQLQAIVANMRGVADPDRRGEVIQAAESALAAMRAAAPWKPQSGPFGGDF